MAWAFMTSLSSTSASGGSMIMYAIWFHLGVRGKGRLLTAATIWTVPFALHRSRHHFFFSSLWAFTISRQILRLKSEDSVHLFQGVRNSQTSLISARSRPPSGGERRRLAACSGYLTREGALMEANMSLVPSGAGTLPGLALRIN